MYYSINPYLDEIEQHVIKFSDQKMSSQNFTIEILNLIFKYISSLSFNEYDIVIKSSFQFEYDFSIFCLSDINEQIKSYSFDVTRIFADYDNFDRLIGDTHIKFIKDGNKIKFKKNPIKIMDEPK